jgi:hypothetical protein
MTDKLTEYTFILPDGSKRYEFAGNLKEVLAFMKMHVAKSAFPTKDQTYRVVWDIDISADSPRDAAERALEIMRDQSAIATVFNCIDPEGVQHHVDLEEEEGE